MIEIDSQRIGRREQRCKQRSTGQADQEYQRHQRRSITPDVAGNTTPKQVHASISHHIAEPRTSEGSRLSGCHDAQAWIEKTVGYIHRQVEQDDQAPRQQRAGHDQGVIAIGRGIHEGGPSTRDVEDCLHEE